MTHDASFEQSLADRASTRPPFSLRLSTIPIIAEMTIGWIRSPSSPDVPASLDVGEVVREVASLRSSSRTT